MLKNINTIKALTKQLANQHIANDVYSPNLLKVVCGIQCKDQIMHYRRGKTAKLPYKKKLSFDYSGDHTYEQMPLDPKSVKSGFEVSSELKDSSDVIKKIFSLEFGDNKDLKMKRMEETLKNVRKHSADDKSLEVSIAALTVNIRNQIEHCMSFRKDKRSKSMLVERLHLRSKLLRRLEKVDYARFLWIQEELQLTYKYLPDKTPVLSKRETRIKIAREAAEELRNHKIAELKRKLEEERVTFEAYKTKELKQIAADLQSLGVSGLETGQVQLSEALQLAGITPPLPQQEKFVNIKTRKLEKKFEMLAHKAIIPKSYIF